MRRSLVVFLVMSFLPGVSSAQSAQCPDCVLGIYDDIGLTQPFGTADGSVKEVFVGIKYAGGFSSLKGVEFSIEGMSSFIHSVDILHSPTQTLGSPPAPADQQNGVGGMRIEWSDCLTGERALAKITLITLGPWPENHVLQILRKFPPSNASLTGPAFTQCDGTLTQVTGEDYILNLAVGLEETTWSRVRSLYR